MKGLILTTGHEIADTVARSLAKGLDGETRYAGAVLDRHVADCDYVIGYGILRGTADVYKLAENMEKPWFVVDKGYFRSGHYNGYYRLGNRCTQGRYVDAQYDMPALPPKLETTGEIGLICPPTPDVARFFGLNRQRWIDGALSYCVKRGVPSLVREKGTSRPLSEDLKRSSFVYTFNSAVGWEALAQGIEVVSSGEHSAVGAYSGETWKLIAWMLQDQFTLKNVEDGKLLERVERWLR